MRGCDLDITGKMWAYRPATHKTQHHGHERLIMIGPRARRIIEPFLKSDLQAHLFSPAESEADRRAAMHAARKTSMKCGNVPGSNRKRRPDWEPGKSYTAGSYRHAISRATDKADAWAKGGRVIGKDERIIPPWHPHQLRHTAATRFRKDYGLEAAQVILGHKQLTVTQLYAEKNVEAATRVMSEAG